jgi:hypothetical protein
MSRPPLRSALKEALKLATRGKLTVDDKKRLEALGEG